MSGSELQVSGKVGRLEWLRKSLHISVGLLALLLRWLPAWGVWLLAAAALVGNGVLLPRLTRRALERDEDRRAGVAWGLLFYPFMVLFLTIVFYRRMEIAAAAWGVMAAGDGFATLFGRRFPSPRWPWNAQKSLAGSAAFVMLGTPAAWALYLFVAAGAARYPDPATALVQVGVATLLAAILESLPTGIDDNLSVPLAAALLLFGLVAVKPSLLAAQAAGWGHDLALGLALNLLLGLAAWGMGSVGGSGLLAGVGLGTFIYTFGGWRGFLVLLTFFVLGSATTRIGYRTKAAAGLAQDRGGARSARNAAANCAAGALLIFFAAATPLTGWLTVAFVAAFATAAFDTVSSEIGQLAGRRTVLITNLRPVPPGTEGAISLEGTLAGLAAALILGGLSVAVGLLPAAGLLPVSVGAFVGAMGESYMGATLEALKLVDNEMVNFLNTLLGAAAALALAPWVM